MSMRGFTYIFVLFFGSAALQAQIPVDTIIERTLSALGGRDKFDEIESFYKEGILSVGVGSDTDNQKKMKIYWIPFKGMRTDIQDEKNIVGSVFTLHSANRYSILLEKDSLMQTDSLVEQFEAVPEYEVRTTVNMTNKFSFLPEFCVNTYFNAHNTVLSGYQYIDGKRCFKLTYKGKSTILVDEKTYLPRQFLYYYRDERDGKFRYMEYNFSDFKPTKSGLLMPFVVEQVKEGNDIPVIYTYNKVMVNEGLPREEILDVAYLKPKHEAYLLKMSEEAERQRRERFKKRVVK